VNAFFASKVYADTPKAVKKSLYDLATFFAKEDCAAIKALRGFLSSSFLTYVSTNLVLTPWNVSMDVLMLFNIVLLLLSELIKISLPQMGIRFAGY
jgi:hypothetical protein